MPRRPLGQIDPNGRRGNELSPYTRGIIMGRVFDKVTPTKIGRDLQIARATIVSTIEKDPERDNGESLLRPGRPEALSPRDKRRVFIEIKRDPFITYDAIRANTGLNYSNTTLLKYVKQSGYGHWKAKKRPYLKPEHAKKRYEWAKAHKNWGWDEWSRIIWSDECSIEIGKGKQNLWVFHLNQLGEKWKKEYIQPYKKGKGISIMIWAAI
ncbi:hypothetical protein DTO164E3_6362 [Paecilomyces variotii]|nr:hypothetical protein DTO164E3_6362 [Paecilomyces variotii]KAJ9288831.1 hypothetical protein DTO021C3_3631 [Paecilomyces variotii]KAJ9407880.1 hypothetical protein DTO045G8_4347 [Paecilomyces variotii]